MKVYLIPLFLTGLLFLNSCHNKPADGSITHSSDTVVNTGSTEKNDGNQPAYSDLSRIDSTWTSGIVSDTNLAMILSSPTAITMIPDSASLERQKKDDSDGFYTMADDYSYYTAMASDTLLQHGIHATGYSHQKRYMVFKSKTGAICTFDGNKMPNSWGTILFNGTDTPVLWNGTDISAAVKIVFKK